jgi:hypothetical protein
MTREVRTMRSEVHEFARYSLVCRYCRVNGSKVSRAEAVRRMREHDRFLGHGSDVAEWRGEEFVRYLSGDEVA